MVAVAVGDVDRCRVGGCGSGSGSTQTLAGSFSSVCALFLAGWPELPQARPSGCRTRPWCRSAATASNRRASISARCHRRCRRSRCCPDSRRSSHESVPGVAVVPHAATTLPAGPNSITVGDGTAFTASPCAIEVAAVDGEHVVLRVDAGTCDFAGDPGLGLARGGADV